jgi:hypothetical protein
MTVYSRGAQKAKAASKATNRIIDLIEVIASNGSIVDAAFFHVDRLIPSHEYSDLVQFGRIAQTGISPMQEDASCALLRTNQSMLLRPTPCPVKPRLEISGFRTALVRMQNPQLTCT